MFNATISKSSVISLW